MSVWVMPSVDVYENFLKRSQAVAGGRRRSQAVGTPSQVLRTRIEGDRLGRALAIGAHGSVTKPKIMAFRTYMKTSRSANTNLIRKTSLSSSNISY